LQGQISTVLDTAITISENIVLLDTVSIVINPTSIITLIINAVLPIEELTGVSETMNIFFELFLSSNMWGYLGPIGLVVIGYLLIQKEKALGIFMIIIYSLVISHYLSLVDTNPGYWWHTIILILGIILCVGKMSQR